jgi:tetratricopeptide (TPR) repeat protein
MKKALDAFEQVGNLTRQAGVLLTLGAVLQWECRWDDALSCYQRAAEISVKVSSAVASGVARINIAEVLTDRGEWSEAESLLSQTLPLWKSSQFRYFLAAAMSVLGRISMRLGRFDEALARLDESKALFTQVGAEGEVPAIDARIAECRVAMGRLDEGLALVNEMLSHATESNSIGKLVPLLQRAAGHAMMKQDDLWGARDALDASLAAAREKRNLFEGMLTMLSLIELDRLEGVEPPLEMVEESRAMLAKLKVRAVPPVPVPSR